MAVLRDAARYGDQSPIAAIATALSLSALAVIRLSGAGTVGLLAAVFSRPDALKNAPGHTIVYGWIIDRAGRKLDQTLVSVYRAPAAYTGEESADISCHGGSAAVRAVFAALLAAGFRQALPGEFTFRAFVNGKLDLTRAESVMELVCAKTDAARAGAVVRLEGGLREKIAAVRASLIDALAEIELNLDYSEIDGITGEGAAAAPRDALEQALQAVRRLVLGYRREKLYRDGVRVVLAGTPNAGKSSLFNRLLNEERAIVADMPGTTRDWIEGWINLDGIPVCFIDTAGLRSPDAAGDAAERAGIEKSRRLAAGADIILLVKDGAAPVNSGGDDALPEDDGAQRRIIVWNKTDLAAVPPGDSAIAVSAKTGAGLAALEAALLAKISALYGGPSGEEGVNPGSDRQKSLLDEAAAALEAAISMTDAGEPLDLIAAELRAAAGSLGEITGETGSADLLENIFRRFCVGK